MVSLDEEARFSSRPREASILRLSSAPRGWKVAAWWPSDFREGKAI